MADITFVPTASEFMFLAVVLDAWSRRIISQAFSHDPNTSVVLDALDMAVAPRKSQGVVRRSYKGSQYKSWAFGHRCEGAGVLPSTGSAGDALCKRFFATLKCEFIDLHRYAGRVEAHTAMFHFIEGFYNPLRRHSFTGTVSPTEFEATN